jgi:hypothetical protein
MTLEKLKRFWVVPILDFVCEGLEGLSPRSENPQQSKNPWLGAS